MAASPSRRYDKYTYSHQRNHSGAERSAYAAPARTVALNPDTSVLNSLRHDAFHFAIAEDGVLHSRVVAPPRVCYAPIIAELDAPAMPKTALARVRGALGLASDAELLTLEWAEVEDALSALEADDAAREAARARDDAAEAAKAKSEAAAGAGAGGVGASPSRRAPRASLWRDYEKITAVDRAKIELLCKRGRLLFDAITITAAVAATAAASPKRLRRARTPPATMRTPEPAVASASTVRQNKSPSACRASYVGSPVSAHPTAATASAPRGASPSPSISATARQQLEGRVAGSYDNNNNYGATTTVDGAASDAAAASGHRAMSSPPSVGPRGQSTSSSGGGVQFGGAKRSTPVIFNEKLRWRSGPKVDTNNS